MIKKILHFLRLTRKKPSGERTLSFSAISLANNSNLWKCNETGEVFNKDGNNFFLVPAYSVDDLGADGLLRKKRTIKLMIRNPDLKHIFNLVRYLDDPNNDVRQSAVIALIRYSELIKEVREPILQLLKVRQTKENSETIRRKIDEAVEISKLRF